MGERLDGLLLRQRQGTMICGCDMRPVGIMGLDTAAHMLLVTATDIQGNRRYEAGRGKGNMWEFSLHLHKAAL